MYISYFTAHTFGFSFIYLSITKLASKSQWKYQTSCMNNIIHKLVKWTSSIFIFLLISWRESCSNILWPSRLNLYIQRFLKLVPYFVYFSFTFLRFSCLIFSSTLLNLSRRFNLWRRRNMFYRRSHWNLVVFFWHLFLKEFWKNVF